MSLCSWITGFLAPRQTKKCFGTTLVIEAELASTQISNVSLVHHQDELCALKVICFDQAKKAIVEREAGDVDAERALLHEGLEKHPHSEKLWLMLGQLERRVPGNDDAAREAREGPPRGENGGTQLWSRVPG